ncbi:hypothetical protein [Pseudoxanthomonas sacheonensis]|uniref:hypothetical protein n=1 Tax=Pseudoxanthomonas sacheonensis TaxID=443615 RepID=UPI0013D83F97|nr:hypothetical protein [Pseudoxanthomonas sacheonensis]KAF1708623.1 hypothetical protein CSC73_07970 [Pseudoxanthomonas sacheonensis]
MTKSLLLATTLLFTACATPDAAAPAASDKAVTSADKFYQSIAALCGRSFAGKIVANTPASAAPDPFEGKALVMHVRDCNENELRIPFHVGDDHSRTWVITRRTDGLRLKHDHRHADGSPDATTMYGGDTRTAGSGRRQEFPVDAESVAMFRAQGMQASLTNTWAMEIQPEQAGVSEFVYELSRPGGRLFRVSFDLTQTVPNPPAPWGASP